MGFNLFDLLLPKEGKFFVLLERQTSLLIESAETFKTSAPSRCATFMVRDASSSPRRRRCRPPPSTTFVG